MVDHLGLHAFLDVCEKFTGTIRYHSEEFSAPQAIITNRDAAVPDAYNDHDIADVHFLENCEQLVTWAILSIVIKSFREHLFLLDWINLADAVGQDSIFSRCKFRAGFRVWHIAEVVDNETDLVLVRNGRTECLELQLFVLLALATRDALDNGLQFFLVKIGLWVDWNALVVIIVASHLVPVLILHILFHAGPASIFILDDHLGGSLLTIELLVLLVFGIVHVGVHHVTTGSSVVTILSLVQTVFFHL